MKLSVKRGGETSDGVELDPDVICLIYLFFSFVFILIFIFFSLSHQIVELFHAKFVEGKKHYTSAVSKSMKKSLKYFLS